MSTRKASSDSATQFSLDLYKEILTSSSSENVFMSPSSILVVMTMVQAGAKNNTLAQMTETLRFGSKAQKEILVMMSEFVSTLGKRCESATLRTANRLFPNTGKTILEEYISTIQNHFSATVKSLDYTAKAEEARREINEWVKSETNGKIVNLLPEGSLSPLTALVVVNAVYFKGNWETQFNATATRKMNFRGLKGVKKVDMMHGEIKRVKFAENRQMNCKVLELPYVGLDIAMVIILPKSDDGLVTLETKLTMQNLKGLMAEVGPMKVAVSIPKFKLESKFELKNILSALGMPDLFDENKADLSGIAEDLHVSEVFHKAFVDVNEEGTEAAAATAAAVMSNCAPVPPELFVADHPFMFMIWDHRLGAPMFIGRFVGPDSDAQV